MSGAIETCTYTYIPHTAHNHNHIILSQNRFSLLFPVRSSALRFATNYHSGKCSADTAICIVLIGTKYCNKLYSLMFLLTCIDYVYASSSDSSLHLVGKKANYFFIKIDI